MGEGGGAWTSAPRKLSVLQKPELRPDKTMSGTRETLAHGVLGYLLALPHSELLALRAKPPHPYDSCTAPPRSLHLVSLFLCFPFQSCVLLNSLVSPCCSSLFQLTML